MNSIHLANKAWEKLRNFSIQEDFHVDLVIKDCLKGVPGTPNFVVENATRRVRLRCKALKVAMKSLKSLGSYNPQTEIYQARLKEVERLSGRIKEDDG